MPVPLRFYFALLFSGFTSIAHAEPLLVSAAASLQDALREISVSYQAANPGAQITYNFAGSGTLQRQIENGAPVDVFIAASTIQMDALEKQSLLQAGSRIHLLSNALVLVTSKERSDIVNTRDLAEAQVKHIAIGEPKTVPAGLYTLEFLTGQHLMPQLGGKLVRLLDVRQVLAAVETGNADAGFVYKTDAAMSKSVRIVAMAPPGSHRPIVYPAAIVRRTKHPDEARMFIDFLKSKTARGIFGKHGFTTVQQNPATK